MWQGAPVTRQAPERDPRPMRLGLAGACLSQNPQGRILYIYIYIYTYRYKTVLIILLDAICHTLLIYYLLYSICYMLYIVYNLYYILYTVYCILYYIQSTICCSIYYVQMTLAEGSRKVRFRKHESVDNVCVVAVCSNYCGPDIRTPNSQATFRISTAMSPQLQAPAPY